MKCPICGREMESCILCGEIDCGFCVPHFCRKPVNFEKALKEEKLKEFTEEDAKKIGF